MSNNPEYDKDVEDAKGWIEAFRTLDAGNINLLMEYDPYVIADALRKIADEWDEFGDEVWPHESTGD